MCRFPFRAYTHTHSLISWLFLACTRTFIFPVAQLFGSSRTHYNIFKCCCCFCCIAACKYVSSGNLRLRCREKALLAQFWDCVVCEMWIYAPDDCTYNSFFLSLSQFTKLSMFFHIHIYILLLLLLLFSFLFCSFAVLLLSVDALCILYTSWLLFRFRASIHFSVQCFFPLLSFSLPLVFSFSHTVSVYFCCIRFVVSPVLYVCVFLDHYIFNISHHFIFAG